MLTVLLIISPLIAHGRNTIRHLVSPARVTASTNLAGFLPSYAFDGNITTVYRANSNRSGNWVRARYDWLVCPSVIVLISGGYDVTLDGTSVAIGNVSDDRAYECGTVRYLGYGDAHTTQSEVFSEGCHQRCGTVLVLRSYRSISLSEVLVIHEIDLEGYENLASTAKSIPTNLIDENLASPVPYSDVTINLSDTEIYKIYKIMIFRQTGSIAGWKAATRVTITGKTTDTTTIVEGLDKVCGETSTAGTSFHFVCGDDAVADTVYLVHEPGQGELSEVVIAGHAWDEFPCSPGYYSTTGKHTFDPSTGCKPCEKNYYNTENGQTECKPCYNDNWMVFYSATMEHKRSSGCEVCLEGQVRTETSDDCGPCDTGQGKHLIKEEVSCSDPSCEETCKKVTYNGKCYTSLKCVECEAGNYFDGTSCKTCPAGEIPTPQGISCTPCQAGNQPSSDKTKCEPCVAGTYKGIGKMTCVSCSDGQYTDSSEQTECKVCPAGSQASSDKTKCEPCVAGAYKGIGQTTCVSCSDGQYTDSSGQTECKVCPAGNQPSSDKTKCEPCVAGTYKGKGQTACVSCSSGYYSDSSGQTECKICPAGHYWRNTETCKKCTHGSFNDVAGSLSCKNCSVNTYSDKEGSIKCEMCPKGTTSVIAATECDDCSGDTPYKIATMMSGRLQQEIEKCIADLGDACYSTTITNKYGTFNVPFLMRDTSADIPCPHDTGHTARVTCEVIDGQITTTEEFFCIDGVITKNINSLKDDVTLGSDQKSAMTLTLTQDTKSLSVGDIKAVDGVMNDIIDKKGSARITKSVTDDLIKAASNLNEITITTESIENTREICNKFMETLKNVSHESRYRNEMVRSENILMLNIARDQPFSPAPSNVLAINVTQDMTSSKLTDGSRNPTTMLQVSMENNTGTSDADILLLIFRNSNMVPDSRAIPLQTDEELDKLDRETMDNRTWETFDASRSQNKTSIVNSYVLEVEVSGGSYQLTELNLKLTPMVDCTRRRVVNGKFYETRCLCQSYNVATSKWEGVGVETAYDTYRSTDGIICTSTHNTSFAVLMSVHEIDPDATWAQSLATYIILGISVFCLILTLAFLLPLKSLRETRSTKVNICFVVSLLLASTLFVIQDLLIKPDNSGVIKLQSTVCLVYAAFQHYLWLVCFMWMVVEGFGMYLSLVQVFGSHISGFILKANIIAWGIPVIFPLIGVFVFTRTKSIGSFTVVEHNYVSDRKCFLKPEAPAFYGLFLGPIVMCIITNLVVFVFVLEVVTKSGKNSTADRKEVIKKQLKACAGIMTLLGTGWIVGTLLSIPEPSIQLILQWVFICLNCPQGIWVFLIYVVLNDKVTHAWLVMLGYRDEISRKSSSTFKSSTMRSNENIYSQHEQIEEKPEFRTYTVISKSSKSDL